MYRPAAKADPAARVRCPGCGWAGRVRNAAAPPAGLVTCPRCGEAVEYAAGARRGGYLTKGGRP